METTLEIISGLNQSKMTDTIETLLVTEIPPPLKHSTVFSKFDALQPNESFLLVNDHDPSPLFYELKAERGDVFNWNKIENGPEEWKVKITRTASPEGNSNEMIGAMVARDIRNAEVFRKFGIDYCCGGKKTVSQACAELNLDVKEVEAALQNSFKAVAGDTNDYTRWQPDFLADYIYNQHHLYYYEEGPVIAELAEKVAERHGKNFPELVELRNLYRTLQSELDEHFQKEETVLFPFIKKLVAAKRSGNMSILSTIPSMETPVKMMEADHEAAGEILAKMRQLTNGFTPPEGSCNSLRLYFQKLSDFEADLHKHVHLENNILFPAALNLQKALN